MGGWGEVPDFEEDGEEGYDVNDGSHEDDMYGVYRKTLNLWKNDVHSEDPFGIYEVLNKKRDGKNIDDKHKDSLKYPSGFTPNKEGDVPVEKVDNWSDKNKVNDGQEDGVCVGQHVHERVEVSNDTHESTCSGHFKKSEVPRKGGSILELIDDLVNVGQTMEYDMTGYYFIMVRGVWVSSGKRLLIISVYAPQDLSEKKMLWDYLSFVIGNWDGEVVIIGDFNEVCDISERFGSIFNKHGEEAFNSFIVNAGLVDVPLGGCSFTWYHKSAKKMSKLDRFLISDNLMCSCPSISSTSLDRFLLDHRPTIMREAHYDYGPIPFKFFHYWFELDGFDKLHKESLNGRKSILKAELADLDGVIDKGDDSDADGHRRREVVRLIQKVEKVDAMEVAKKSKIKCPIDGDENSKYYHGVLNKKRGRVTIRGVLVYGIWMESPHLVKHEFFEHFKNRFEKPNKSRILLERDFVKRISLKHNDDLEREVSNEEIKRVVWDCGIDKAPGPDGFTFGIYRWYWDIIGNDVDVDKWFFCMERSRKEVDFEKEYDSVRWDFVDDILRRFGFGEKWCKWIQSCLYSSRGSVLVNGSPTKEFQFQKGLFNGIKLDSSLQISHLFYADGAIFMGQWSQCNIDTIIRVLDVFYRASGLRINMNKSNLMGISVDSTKVKHAAAKIVSFALNYAILDKIYANGCYAYCICVRYKFIFVEGTSSHLMVIYMAFVDLRIYHNQDP
nr:RNA-directed DNA polymerase, eukaryota [Tanacetum cinerariifolium]